VIADPGSPRQAITYVPVLVEVDHVAICGIDDPSAILFDLFVGNPVIVLKQKRGERAFAGTDHGSGEVDLLSSLDFGYEFVDGGDSSVLGSQEVVEVHREVSRQTTDIRICLVEQWSCAIVCGLVDIPYSPSEVVLCGIKLGRVDRTATRNNLDGNFGDVVLHNRRHSTGLGIPTTTHTTCCPRVGCRSKNFSIRCHGFSLSGSKQHSRY